MDLLALTGRDAELAAALAPLLSSPHVFKLGCGLAGDLRKLAGHHPAAFSLAHSCLDLSAVWRAQQEHASETGDGSGGGGGGGGGPPPVCGVCRAAHHAARACKQCLKDAISSQCMVGWPVPGAKDRAQCMRAVCPATLPQAASGPPPAGSSGRGR